MFEPWDAMMNGGLSLHAPPSISPSFQLRSGGVNGSPGRAAGARRDCAAGRSDVDPRYQLTSIEEYQSFLRGLKPLADDSPVDLLRLAVIAAPPTPVLVGLDGNGYPDLTPSCTGAPGGGDPAIRLAALTSSMPQTNFASVCRDYAGHLEAWAGQALQAALATRECGP